MTLEPYLAVDPNGVLIVVYPPSGVAQYEAIWRTIYPDPPQAKQ